MNSLKALENIKSRINSVSLFPKVDRKTYDESWKTIEKDLEILTLLHDKDVVLECVKVSSNYKEYVIAVKNTYGNVYIDLNEQEYEILKEWLNNGRFKM